MDADEVMELEMIYIRILAIELNRVPQFIEHSLE